MSHPLICLGLESSCDDTAAALLKTDGETTEILSSVVFDQMQLHSDFGGVVPEIAARAHAERLDICVETAMRDANMPLEQIDLIAVTAGPGLVGGVMSGVMCAKGLAAGLRKPLIGVNHLAGHALTPRLTDTVPYPYLMLLVSGGHCQFLIAHGPEKFSRLGGTIDDAPGEAFDKTARILGLSQPGGPSVSERAKLGDPNRFRLPRPLLDRPDLDLSFSGLKTALVREKERCEAADGTVSQQDISDLCASFEVAVADVLTQKTKRALEIYLDLSPSRPSFAIAGGVAANAVLRERLVALCDDRNIAFIAPPIALCTDNAAMIAYAGAAQFLGGRVDDMTLASRPRWPLDPSKAPMLGSGKKGAKA